MRNLLKALLLPSVAIIAIVSGVGMYAVRSGLSARNTPNSLESQIALRLRRLAVPKGAKQQKNPFSPSAELLTDARRHFPDHCASCHANNGSGNTQLGHSLYPRAPDMREPRTQSLSDGDSITSSTTAFVLPGCQRGAGIMMKTVGSWSCLFGSFVSRSPDMMVFPAPGSSASRKAVA
jgi:hypothetical protein